ncbi:MAG TPA: aldehyde dehydrogenase family protein [Candidatus Saccharimonadales bacterium]|nr:aldehyde dehydrogenase family protein [Candidatus Saccharimonadales bacterium]
MLAPTKAQVKPAQLFIAGRFVPSASGETFDSINPATGAVLTQVAQAGPTDIDAAVKAAREAFESGPWPKMSVSARGRLLWKIGDLIMKRREEIAELETLDSGKPLTDNARIDVPMAADCFQYYAGWATKIHGRTIPSSGPYFNFTLREPVGVVGAIIPWNFPFLMAAWKLAPALCAGNTAVLKPAEQTPLTAVLLGEILAEAGVPEGVVNIVTGDGPGAGAALVRHPGVDKIAFTGSTPVGQEILRASADTLKRVSLELGGKSPSLVFADADMEQAVRGATTGIFYNEGQICTAASRLFVESSVHESFMEALGRRTAKMVAGDPLDPKCRFGPLVSEAQMSRVLRYIGIGRDEGAKLVAGGGKARVEGGGGFYVEPTIFDGVRNDMTIAREEIFGPVLAVIPFDDPEEAVRQANDNPYGLAAAVWTRDIKKAHSVARRLRAGTVWINTVNALESTTPFGGYKMSGFGRELGEASLDLYTQTKSVWVDLS